MWLGLSIMLLNGSSSLLSPAAHRILAGQAGRSHFAYWTQTRISTLAVTRRNESAPRWNVNRDATTVCGIRRAWPISVRLLGLPPPPHLLPPQRDNTITSRLRSAAIYPGPATRTKRFTSSVQYIALISIAHSS